mgnify:CR=1 FL=1
MNARRLCAFLPVVAVVASGCTTAPSAPDAGAEPVRIYHAAMLLPGQYTTVKNLWVDSWRSAFWVPDYQTVEEGTSALRDEAARLGANGVINVACYQVRPVLSSWSAEGPRSFICYGKAIRVKDAAKS